MNVDALSDVNVERREESLVGGRGVPTESDGKWNGPAEGGGGRTEYMLGREKRGEFTTVG